MRYICHKRYKGPGAFFPVNVPYGTICEEREGIIFQDDYTPLCYDTSEDAHQHLARDDDGMGLERGGLTQAIQRALARPGKGHQERWDKVWEDPLCQTYKKRESPKDYWLWGDAFFKAPIEDLEHIAALVGARKGA